MLGCFVLLSRGDVASYPENQEWPVAAFSCAHVRLYVYGMCSRVQPLEAGGRLHMIVGHCGLHCRLLLLSKCIENACFVWP